MGGNHKESDQENAGNKKGLHLDPGFISIEADDDLEYSRVAQDKNLELWLLQIPIDFPLDEKVVWQATKPGSRRVSAICEIEDAGYRLLEEQETGQAPVYAIGGENPEPAKVTRRLNIVKRTDAQKVCFGIEDADVLEDVDAGRPSPSPSPAPTLAATPSKDKVAKKEKKKDKKKKRDETSAEPDTEQKKKKSKRK
ncbi:hypothetical protein Ndes2526B_g01641 [Nannochloris sp. 'desiccata']|nr:hypothetical protein NADE_002416 [Chlorella desiccata (nom. nud.)]